MALGQEWWLSQGWQISPPICMGNWKWHSAMYYVSKHRTNSRPCKLWLLPWWWPATLQTLAWHVCCPLMRPANHEKPAWQACCPLMRPAHIGATLYRMIWPIEQIHCIKWYGFGGHCWTYCIYYTNEWLHCTLSIIPSNRMNRHVRNIISNIWNATGTDTSLGAGVHTLLINWWLHYNIPIEIYIYVH
jgi:hypothetical protein